MSSDLLYFFLVNFAVGFIYLTSGKQVQVYFKIQSCKDYHTLFSSNKLDREKTRLKFNN